MPKSKSSPFEPSMEEKADMNRPVEPSTRMGMPEPGSSEMPSMEQQEDAPRMPYDPMNEPTGPAKPSAYHDSDSYAHESIIDSSSVDHMSNQDLDAAYDYVPSKQ